MDRTYILASGSPRRIEMMRKNGYTPMVMPSDIEENLPLRSGMTETAMFLALKKAHDVEKRYLASLPASGSTPQNPHGTPDGRPPVIIAADTIVFFEGEVMGKPADREDAFRMLSALRNNAHYVVTGVALTEAGAQNTRVFCDITMVYFKNYTDEELWEYLDTDEAYDKAGGYAIQGYFARYVDHFVGDYDNVVGFPWLSIKKELKWFE